MSRAVLLPIPGDPYIAKLWLSSWERFWGPNKGQLYAMVNTPLEHPVVDYTIKLFEDVGAKVFFKERMMSHGPAITRLMDECNEDTIFIVEDDFYMLKPGNIDYWFNLVESGSVDAVVSPRGCTGPDIMQKTVETYGLPEYINGINIHQQTNFWPSLVVVPRENLMKTDLNFEAFRFIAGQPIEGLKGYTPPVDVCGDTFVSVSIQLRHQGLKFHYEDQHRLIDVVNAGKIRTTPWVHVGSSSTSLNSGLLGENMQPIGNQNTGREWPFQPVPDDGIRNVFEEKFAWWKMCNEKFPIPDSDPAAYFNKVYNDAVHRSVKGCKLRPAGIDKKYKMFETLLEPLL